MVHHCFTDVEIWASLGKAQITKIAYKFRRDRRTAQLYSCRQRSIDDNYRELDKAGIRKSRTTLGDIVGLHNCAVADITPQLWHDITPQLRSSAKRKDGGTNMMITYDVTPQQRLNPSAKRWMAEPADRL